MQELQWDISVSVYLLSTPKSSKCTCVSSSPQKGLNTLLFDKPGQLAQFPVFNSFNTIIFKLIAVHMHCFITSRLFGKPPFFRYKYCTQLKNLNQLAFLNFPLVGKGKGKKWLYCRGHIPTQRFNLKTLMKYGIEGHNSWFTRSCRRLIRGVDHHG